MKRIFGLLLLSVFALLISPVVQAQEQTPTNSQTTVVENFIPQILTIDGIQYIAMSDATKFVLGNSKNIGWGKEIGEMIKEALMAVVEVAQKFSDTNVGKFTMYMVAWKVMGQDIVRILLGLLFFTTFVTTLILIYRRVVLPRKYMIENPGFLRYPKKYEVVETGLDSDGIGWVTLLFVVAFLLCIWITYAIMF